MGGPATRRLFTALWPSPAVRGRLAAHRDGWAWPDGARTVADDDLHATLHFVGAVPAHRVDALADALAGVPMEPVAVSALGTATWPGGIAVLTLARTAALETLHRRVGDVLADAGIPLDARPYAPHVTLARRADGATAPAPAPRLGWRASRFVLAESRPGRTYAVIATFGGPVHAVRRPPRESRR